MRCFIIIITLFTFYNSMIAQNEAFQTHVNILQLDELKNKIFESREPYKIVFIFNQFCSASRDVFPELDELYKKAHKENFELFVVTNTKEKNKEELEDHLFYYGYGEPFYILKDKPLLGFLKKTIQSICESCNANEMGYSSFMVFNENNEVLEQTNYNQTKEEIISTLKKYIQ
ncbi:hypothetical protein [Mesonia aestuariivivens]|uniref:Redoxin domain-containing protein n=1 Tax=Mesonia aestuariivivens TaxID=2796128 RepID=A0ABS6W1L6_9FLAO|nr:hypothetical protein [Mesonia aestuariivivens]MBW2961725.1 hypothetical protein [Mesonia aestuariivivens]